MTNYTLDRTLLVPVNEVLSERAPTLLGVGMNSVTGEILSQALTVDGTAETEAKQVSAEFFAIDDIEQLIASTDAHVGASFSKRQDYKAKFVQSIGVLQSTSLYVLLAIRVELKTALTTSVTLTASALDRLPDPAAFMTQYGDQFVSEILRGGDFFGVIQIETPYREDRRLAQSLMRQVVGKFNLETELESRLRYVRGLPVPRCTLYRSGLLPESPSYDRFVTYAKSFPGDIGTSGGGDVVTRLWPYTKATNYPSTVPAPGLSAQTQILTLLERFATRGLSSVWTVNLALKNSQLFDAYIRDQLLLSKGTLDGFNDANATEGNALLADVVNYAGGTPSDDPDTVHPLPTFRESRTIPLKIWMERGGRDTTGDGSGCVGDGIDGLIHRVSVELVPTQPDLSLRMQICYVASGGPTQPWAAVSEEYDAQESRHYQMGIKGIRLWLIGSRKEHFRVSYSVQLSPNAATYSGTDGDKVGDWANIGGPAQYHNQALCVKVSIASTV